MKSRCQINLKLTKSQNLKYTLLENAGGLLIIYMYRVVFNSRPKENETVNSLLVKLWFTTFPLHL